MIDLDAAPPKTLSPAVPGGAAGGSGAVMVVVGRKLRAARRVRGWSLQAASQRSGGHLSAAALGSYERAERTMAASLLLDLADLYHVHPTAFLPAGHAAQQWPHQPRLVLDLAVVAALPAAHEPLRTFAAHVRAMRDDYGSPILSIRHTDLQALAVMYADDTDHLRRWLIKLRVLRPI